MSRQPNTNSTEMVQMDTILEQLKHWCFQWGVRGFEAKVEVHFSSRLRRSLGRCQVKRHRIILAERLKRLHGSILEEVLCHEMAHLVVVEVHGERCRPHGPEWARLMQTAGFKPRTRISLDNSGTVRRSDRQRHRYFHTCPVCQTTVVAGRPVYGWRCVACLGVGLEGLLHIERRPVNHEVVL